MRRFLSIIGALIATAAFPAAASAHHINHYKSTVDCSHAVVAFESFSTYDYRYGVDTHVSIDGRDVAFVHTTPAQIGGRSSFTVTVTYAKPKDTAQHTVAVRSNWWTGHDGYSGTVSKCTPPPPPPPPCGTTCKPSPPPCTVACTPPPPPPPCTMNCTPPPPPCVGVKCHDDKATCPPGSKYSITVRPRHAAHGLVRFRLNGPYVKRVRWYVDMHRRGVQGRAFERTSGKGGRVYRVWLWAQPVWGDSLWGYHWVTVRATVAKGCTVHKRLRYFNQDPPLV